MSELTEDATTESGYKEVMLGPKTVSVPESWTVEKIGSDKITNKIKAGGTPKATNENYYGGDIKYVKIEDMTAAGKYIKTTKNYLTKEGLDSSSTWLVPKSSLLLSMYGSYGKVTITQDTMATNQAILGIIPSDRIDLNYLYYASSSLKPYFESVVLETTQANLNKGIVENTPILFPSHPEQRRIAKILSTVDEQIQQTEKIVEGARKLMRGLMQDLFETGVSKKTKTKGTPYGELPKHWDLRPLKKLTVSGISYGAVKPGDYHEQGIPMIRAKDIENGRLVGKPYRISPEKAKEYQRTEIKEGDILLSIMGTVGRSMCAPSKLDGGNVNRALCTIRVNQEDLIPEFVDFWFRSDRMQSFFDKEKYGSAQKRLNISFLKSMKVPIPPYDEQESIVNILQKLEEKIQKEIEYRNGMQELKTGLMQDLLTGKVRVNTDRLCPTSTPSQNAPRLMPSSDSAGKSSTSSKRSGPTPARRRPRPSSNRACVTPSTA